jgi:hypothetical protein
VLSQMAMKIEPTFVGSWPESTPLERSSRGRTKDRRRTFLRRIATAFSMLSLFLIFVAPLIMSTMRSKPLSSSETNSSSRERPTLSSRELHVEKYHEEEHIEPLPVGRAAYIEQPPAARTTSGTVAWSQISDKSGNAVRATLYIADQNIVVTITFSENHDPSLAANYLIQIELFGAFDEGPIRAISRMFVAQSAGEEGRELAGAPVAITNDLFWYALSKDTIQDNYNRQLLGGAGSWVGLTLLFGNMKEARLTFETSETGSTLLRDLVMASLRQETP